MSEWVSERGDVGKDYIAVSVRPASEFINNRY